MALLNEIIERARQAKVRGIPLQAVFDLDSTLFNVSPRITAILHSFAQQESIVKRYPEQSAALLKIKPHNSDYGVKRTLERVGFVPPDDIFLRELIAFWKNKFFSSEFLAIDTPYEGAASFISALSAAGAEIFYLTGRDIPRMLKGTLEALQVHGFPVGNKDKNVHLKPTTALSDGDFKHNFFAQLDRQYDEVWFFENEPRNLEVALKAAPHIHLVFVATVHSGADPEPGLHIPRISNWERSLKD